MKSKSHPAFDLLDRYFDRMVMGNGLPVPAGTQGGSADGAASTADPEVASQILAQDAMNEVAGDSAFIQLLGQAMGAARPPKGSGRAL